MVLSHLNISIEDLSFFYHVVEKGGFLKAAEALKVCQGKISRRISRVEAAFGSILLYRNMRNVRLTETGHIVFKLAQSVVEDTNHAYTDVQNCQKDPSGPIRLSVVMGFAHYWVMSRLAKFKESYPDIQVHLITDEGGYSDVMMGKADMTISTMPPAKRARLKSELLCEYPFHVYASKNYLQRKGIPKIASDLDHHNIITTKASEQLSPMKDLLDILLRLGREPDDPRSPSFVASTDLAVVSATVEGMGLAGMPDFFAIRHPELVRIDIEGAAEAFSRHKNQKFITYAKSLQKSERHRNLIQFFKAEADASPF